MRALGLGILPALALLVGSAGVATAKVDDTPGTHTLKTFAAPAGHGKAGGPVHFHAVGKQGEHAVVGVHGRHLAASQPWYATVYAGPTCTGTELGRAGPRTAHENGHGVLKVATSVSRDQIGSAGVLDASGQLLGCAPEPHGGTSATSHAR